MITVGEVGQCIYLSFVINYFAIIILLTSPVELGEDSTLILPKKWADCMFNLRDKVNLT